MNSIIRSSAIALTALLCCGTALAQSRAVEATQFAFDATSINSDTSDSTSSGTLGAALGVTLPIGSYFGASLSGRYADSSVRTSAVLGDSNTSGGSRPSCSFQSLAGTASLFFRRPTFGRAGVSYTAGDLKANCDGDAIFPLTNDNKASTTSYRADAEYYLGDFTFGAAYTTTTLESSDDLKTTTLAVSWYPIDSLKVGVFGNDLYKDNSYGVMVEHQPEMLGDGVSVRLGFSTSESSPRTTTFEIGLTYFFGSDVSLKARDRQYR